MSLEHHTEQTDRSDETDGLNVRDTELIDGLLFFLQSFLFPNIKVKTVSFSWKHWNMCVTLTHNDSLVDH